MKRPADTEPAKVRAAWLHDRLRSISVGRTKDCRRKRIASYVQIQRTPDGSTRLEGLCTCGSPWGCPSCATKIYSQRAEEVTHATTQWRDSGGYVYMLTHTLKHEWSSDLRVMRTGLSKAVSRMWQGKGGQALMRRIGKKHHIRAIEVTHGKNGYHPHVHTLLFLDKKLTKDDRNELAERWKDSVAVELGSPFVPDDEHGTSIDDSHRTDYISKLGLEVVAITSKAAKAGNRTMWQVAKDAANGDRASKLIWNNYVHAMYGCRQLFWSKAAKSYFGIKRLSDEQIAGDTTIETGEALGVATVLASWKGLDWDSCARRHDTWLAEVMRANLAGLESLLLLPMQEGTTTHGHVPIKTDSGQHPSRAHIGFDRSRLDANAVKLLVEQSIKRRAALHAALQGERDWFFAHPR